MRRRSSFGPRSFTLAGRVLALALVGASSALVASTAACTSDAVGVDACRKIERARCESAAACGIDLSSPVHGGNTPVSDVAACIRYYDDQCLRGIVASSKEPAPRDVDACVNAIITGDCSVVRTPETHPSCGFLVPPQAPPQPDASTDSDAAMSNVEAGPG